MSESSPTGVAEAIPESPDQELDEWMRDTRAACQSVRFGSVTLTIHDGKIQELNIASKYRRDQLRGKKGR